jgi:cell division protein FtsB
VYERYSQARILRKAAEERLALLEERRGELETALENLGSERGFEEEVRKRFGVVLPGEKVIEIVDVPPPAEPALERRNLLERILDLF